MIRVTSNFIGSRYMKFYQNCCLLGCDAM